MNSKLNSLNKSAEVTENKQSITHLEFSDVTVYNEMADQTSVKLNLLEQIHMQLNQLQEMSERRNFLMKEILQNIVD